MAKLGDQWTDEAATGLDDTTGEAVATDKAVMDWTDEAGTEQPTGETLITDETATELDWTGEAADELTGEKQLFARWQNGSCF